MRNKFVYSVIGVYLIYALLMFVYLFVIPSSELSSEFNGTSIDPATFMTKNELDLSEDYSKIRNFLFFLEIPFEWVFYCLLLVFGIGKAIENWSQQITKIPIIHSAIFTFNIALLSVVIFLPLNFLRYQLSKSYGISAQSTQSWIRDELIDFWLNWGMLFLIVSVLYWLLNRFKKRWWLYAWMLTIPFSIFYMFIQPVVIDPLYNEFYPIQDKELETKILNLASSAGIPAEHVYEVNMSEKTNTLNAYVTGIGSNSRIVLWDTTLNQLNEDEILFIMAHEMAHYKEKHIYIGLAGYILLLFGGLFLTAKLLNWTVKKYGNLLKVQSSQSFSGIILIILLTSILSFVSSPFVNAVSRYQEMRADRYAIELTQDTHAGVSTFHHLTRAGLSQVDPPILVKWFRYGHPTMKERILMVENYKSENE